MKKRSMLDHYVVKNAYSKKWMPSDEVDDYCAAEAFFMEAKLRPNKRMYIHVKHLYDGEITKYCFYHMVATYSHIVR